jgi:signal transduction histidine kinase
MHSQESGEQLRYLRIALYMSAAFAVLLVVLLALPEFPLFTQEQLPDLLLLHLFFELFSIIVCVLVAAIAWNTLEEEEIPSANVVIAGFASIAALDLVHALTYEGMPPFLGPATTQRAIYFWLAARSVETLTLAAIALRVRLPGSRPLWLLIAAVTVSLFGWVGLVDTQYLPQFFIVDQGVTPLKRWCEILLCLLHLPIALVLWRQAARYHQPWMRLLAGAALIGGMGELAFSSYHTPSAFVNMFGHLYKIAAYALIFRGICLTALRLPYVRLERVVTEQIKAREEIDHLNTELEQRVTQRTRELQRVNSELEEFAASVSHDLQAPLRAIGGYASMLQEDSKQLPEDSHRQLDVIIAETAHAQQLVADLLRLARLNSAQLNRSSLDPAALSREVLEALVKAHPERHIRWRVDPLPQLSADPGLFRQVLVNLLSNAVKFTTGRSPAIVSVERADALAQPGELVLCFRDNGAGFDMRYIKRLFGTFQRLHTQSEFEGTGVGLANVKRIVERHGGRVWAEGTPGVGATFYIAIPVA